jgi:hypothetical protein
MERMISCEHLLNSKLPDQLSSCFSEFIIGVVWYWKDLLLLFFGFIYSSFFSHLILLLTKAAKDWTNFGTFSFPNMLMYLSLLLILCGLVPLNCWFHRLPFSPKKILKFHHLFYLFSPCNTSSIEVILSKSIF